MSGAQANTVGFLRRTPLSRNLRLKLVRVSFFAILSCRNVKCGPLSPNPILDIVLEFCPARKIRKTNPSLIRPNPWSVSMHPIYRNVGKSKTGSKDYLLTSAGEKTSALNQLIMFTHLQVCQTSSFRVTDCFPLCPVLAALHCP